ncbi:glucose-6-phosphatase catalytic subunit 1-like [Discoglossus pictus]
MEVGMDALHATGITTVSYLQENFMGAKDWFLFVSFAADLHNTLFFFFPIWFHLSESVGIKLVWVAVMGDWLNLVFKWILFGQRPYWWVQETSYYGDASAPIIQQFPITCETGPGSPSGHAMGSSAVYYVMACAVLTLLVNNQSPLKNQCKRWAVWSVFWAIQINVCLSRVFVAAHFPHQVIAGIISGMLFVELFDYVHCACKASLTRYICTTLFLFLFALGFYLLLKSVGVDLLWTMEKAKKWCAHPEWIHIDTAPFAGLIRNLGVFVGLGLALNTQMYKESCQDKHGSQFTFRLCCLVVSLLIIHVFDSFELPTHEEMLFYVLCFCKSIAVPLTTVGLVPYCVSHSLKWQEKKVL